MASKLDTLCTYAKGKIAVENLNAQTYISTENMMPNKDGIVDASFLPSVQYTQQYLKGDVLVSNIRPYFKKIWMANYDGGCSNDVLVFRAKDGCDPTFLYYVLANDVFFDYTTATSKGTKMPRGDKNAIMQYDVPDFDLDTQLRIGKLLRSLDDRIAINKKINDNLQQQMSAIYKEKFSYVLQGDTATVEQIVAFSNGKKRPNEEGNIPVYGGNGVLAYTNKFNSQNCIIIGRVGAYCGNVSYSPKECWVSDNAIEAKSKVSASQLFAFHLLKNAELPSRHIGTGQPLMTQGILNAIPCALPDLSEIDAFNDLCEPLQQQFDNNLAENAQLAALRETILPKLMSGELSLSDIEL